MHHPRFGANGGGYMNTNNQRNIGNSSGLFMPQDALSALSLTRQLVSDSAFSPSQPIFRNPNLFQSSHGSRNLPPTDLPNVVLLPGVLPHPPHGLPMQHPPMWNPAMPQIDGLNRPPGGILPSHRQSWERSARPPGSSSSSRSSQDQPLDLTKKVAPAPKARVSEQSLLMASTSQVYDPEAPIDFSTKPRNRDPISSSNSVPRRASFSANSPNPSNMSTFDSSIARSQAMKESQQTFSNHPAQHRHSNQPSSNFLLQRQQRQQQQQQHMLACSMNAQNTTSVVQPSVSSAMPSNNGLSIYNSDGNKMPIPKNKEELLSSMSNNSTPTVVKEPIVVDGPATTAVAPAKAPVPSCHSVDSSPANLLPAVTAPFPWFTYLSESRYTAVPEAAFPHVAEILMPIVQVNSVCDFIHNKVTQYWPCLVCAVSKYAIQIRYVGAEPGCKRPGGRFWVEAGDERMKPRGWGQKQKLAMRLPTGFELFPGVTSKDVVQMTLRLQPLSNVLMQHSATCCADLFLPGRLIELQDSCDPRVYWFVRVIRNYGGRLCIQYVTAPEHETAPAIEASPHVRSCAPQPAPMWLFASSRRLRPVGWAHDNDCVYKAPAGIRIVGSPFIISKTVLGCVQLKVNQIAFQARGFPPPISHSFMIGDRIDWLHPSRLFFCAASVRRIADSEHFVISSYFEGKQTTGHVTTLSDGECFPYGFANENKLAYRDESGNVLPTILPASESSSMTKDKGIKESASGESNTPANKNKTDKNSSTINNNASEEKDFVPGRKLEIVVPNSPELLTVATVVKLIHNSVVLVEVDATKAIYIFPKFSPDLLPVGFAEMSKNPMTLLPQVVQQRRKQVAVVQPEVIGHQSSKFSSGDNSSLSVNGRRPFAVISSPPHDAPVTSPSEQAAILFSSKCFSGKLLSKSKVATLPTKIGPCDVLSLLKEALTYLLNTAYKPSQVLRILHVKTAKLCRREPSGYSAQQLKARLGSKIYKATTVLCTKRQNLPGYLRRIAHLLGFCPGLIYAIFTTDEGKQVERPPCSQTCRKIVSRPVTTRRAAAAAASAAVASIADRDRRSSGKMLSVVVPPRHSPHSILAPDARRNASLQNQRDSSAGPSSATSDSRSPRSVSPATMEQLVGNLPLSTNPLRWSVDDVTHFMQYHECGDVAEALAEQEIDGPSLLLLNLAVIQDYLSLRMGPTLKLCRLLERLHIAFRQQLDLARDYFLTSSSSLLTTDAAELFGGLQDLESNNDNNDDGNDNNKEDKNMDVLVNANGYTI